jgi:putative Holliday junction resolvase
MAVQTTRNTNQSTYLSLDIGARRIGVALANPIARIPHPHTTVAHDKHVFTELQAIIAKEAVGTIVAGLPRNLNGDDTPQTEIVRKFVTELEDMTGMTVKFQDEALTSVKAEQELAARGKQYVKGDVDALAATYILEDYLQNERY